jgi:mono/diheme cytochrome c family protein
MSEVPRGVRPFRTRPDMRHTTLLAAIALVVVIAMPGGPAWAGSPLPDLVAKGKYIFAAAGGCGCHTEPGKAATGLNAGGRKFDAPFGTVYATNITPDRQTGIGTWTDEQIIAGIRVGRRPNGERIIPIHPFMTFNGMAEEDLRALVAYLKTLPPIIRPNQPKKISVPLFESVFLPAWLAAFVSKETPPPQAPTSGLPRGEYLVRVVGHCGECHTPRGITQATDNSRFLAGNPKGPENSVVPNITPDKDTGLTWSEEEIAEYMGTGNTPAGDVAGGLMGEIIQGTSVGYKDLTKADRVAIARYLKAVPAIKNKIGK